MVSGLQGGVVFGGKLFHPTVAVMAMVFLGSSTLMRLAAKEIYGFGRPADDSR